MTSRPVRLWILFGSCLLVLLGSVAWISVTAVSLQRSEAQAKKHAALEENVRLALWRMDSFVTPVLAREIGRPVASYRSALPVPEFVRMHFELGPDGTLRSPQGDSEGLDTLSKFVTTKAVEAVGLDSAAVLAEAEVKIDANAPRQTVKSIVEWQNRNNSYAVGNVYRQVAQDGTSTVARSAARAAPLAPMQPVWIGHELLLLRRATRDGVRIYQGAWLDWPSLAASLVSDVKDLLPEASLEASPAGPDGERSLASLPVRLIAGNLDGDYGGGSPVTMILIAVWCAVLLAAAAVTALVFGTVSLSERRASFVSAVTHELRTPLTTLQTYSEMLVDDRVTEPAKRRQYIATLHREAIRLGHLVENVLSFSRIERGRDGARTDTLAAGEVLRRVKDRLEPRVAQAKMRLEVETDDSTFIGDEGAVERILFNLVDNACKYAAGDGLAVHIDARNQNGHVAIRVSDHGPGIPKDVRAKLFESFSKSAQEAARSAPGIGLGLALSRRLARAMGGDLSLERTAESGSVFVLRLRAA